MNLKYKILFFVSLFVFLLDQATKWLVTAYIPLYGKVSVIPDYFDIVFVRNTGAAFGMFAGVSQSFREPFFYIIAAVAVVALMVFYIGLSDRAKLLHVAASLVLGGIAGNILDRIRFGAVTDFLSVHIQDVVAQWEIFGKVIRIPLDWPSFNVADSAITIAMFLFLFSAFRKEEVGK